MSNPMDRGTIRTGEFLCVEIAALMHFVHSTAVGSVTTDAERLWIRARMIQQAATDVLALAGALEVLARKPRDD